jgi:type II secretory pathway pseudopilin PulG
MMKMNHGNERGFTLAETLVALVVGMVLLTAIYSVVNMAQKSTTGIERKVVAQQDARTALEIMALEIRMASYNGVQGDGIWFDPSTCAAANPTYRGIRNATPNSLTVEMDLNDDGDLGDGNEIIAYEYLPGEQRVTRATGCPLAAAQPLLGPSAGDPESGGVKVINGSLGLDMFKYYDETGTNTIDPVATPGDIPAIRRIEITIAVETKDVDPGTNQKRKLIYRTSVIPKNHGINF